MTQTVTIENLRGNMAPAAHEATELRAASRSLYYELESGTLLVSGSELATSNSYTIVSAVADPPPFVLDSASSLSPPSARYLSVPDNDEMRELGEGSSQLHAEIGEFARQCGVSRLLAVGDEARHAVEAFGAGSTWFASAEDLIASLADGIGPGITVLVKGSRSSRTERVVGILAGSP